MLHAVDFEQLQIENKDCQERLEEKLSHLIDVKTINGRFGVVLNSNKKKLQELMDRLSELQANTVVKEKMIKELKAEEEKVNSEVKTAVNAVKKIVSLMKSYTVSDVMDYILKKAELYDLKKDMKVSIFHKDEKSNRRVMLKRV